MKQLAGVFPVISTPFTVDDEIDIVGGDIGDGIDRMYGFEVVEWHI